MKKNLLAIMGAILVGLVFSSCTKVKGEGPVLSEIRTAPRFQRIRLAMSATVFVQQDRVFKVELRGQKNILDIVNTSVSGSELKIDFDYNKRIGQHEKVEVLISCPNIEALSVSGSGSIMMNNKCSSSNLDLSVSGSGSIRLVALNTNVLNTKISGSGDIVLQSGWATTHSVEISGSGTLKATELESDYTTARISGSGDAKVNVSKMLEVRISGSGSVYYLGMPRINQSISGSGKLIRL